MMPLSRRLAIVFAVVIGSAAVLPVNAVVESSSVTIAQNAKAQKFRTSFQSSILKSCISANPKKRRECSCYSQIVTKRYRTRELVFINSFAQSKKVSSKPKNIIPIMLMPELRACKVVK